MPGVAHPEDAKVPAQIAADLKTLSRSWSVAVVTGRSVEDVRKKLDFTPDYLFGNHGAERADQLAPHHLYQKLNGCREFLSASTALLAARKVRVEDKGLSLALHYRQSENPVATRAWLRELVRSVSENMVVTDGHMVINMVLAHAPDKGDAVQTILQESGTEYALLVGDDENDEAAFVNAPEHAVTVRIGPPAVCSRARFSLSGQHQVSALLTLLVNQKGS